MEHFAYTSASPVGWLKKIVVLVLTASLAVLALMFSVLLLAAILIAGSLALAYVWWKTRKLRKLVRSRMRDFSGHETGVQCAKFEARVIEGEVIRVERSGIEPRG